VPSEQADIHSRSTCWNMTKEEKGKHCVLRTIGVGLGSVYLGFRHFPVISVLDGFASADHLRQ